MSTTTNDITACLSAEQEAQPSGHEDNADNAAETLRMVPEASPARRNRSCKDGCIVADCHRKLNSRYERRYRLCGPHMKAPEFLVSGRLCRWCQKCGKFHSLDDFDGLKKSCRASLARHNERQKEARARHQDCVAALHQLEGAPPGMELRRRAIPDAAQGIAAVTPPVFVPAASLPPPHVHSSWEVSVPAQRSVLPTLCIEGSLTLAATPMPVLPQAQASADARSSSPPAHSAATTFCLPVAPSMELPASSLPPIEADIAEAFSAAVHAAADAAFGALPAAARRPAATGASGVGAAITHAALLEPSIDAREAHELRSLGLGQLDPACMPPVLEIPL